MENVVIEYNVTWYDKVSHENFTATFGTKKSAVEHATFVKSQNLAVWTSVHSRGSRNAVPLH